MRMNKVYREITSGDKFYLSHVFGEVGELFEEIVKMNKNGIKEEFSDVFVFLQLWLYDKYKINSKLWDVSFPSYYKFKKRVTVWNEIYEYVGLKKNIDNFAGNYKRKHKVINQLKKYSISETLALEAFENIVIPLTKMKN